MVNVEIVTNSCNSNDNIYYLTCSTLFKGIKRVVKKNKGEEVKQNKTKQTKYLQKLNNCDLYFLFKK